MYEPSTLAVVFGVFLLAGLVKGTVGTGLPAISVGMLTALLGLTPAMAMASVPSFLTNVWQACTGGHGKTLVRRIWPFLLCATVTVPIGALALTRIDQRILSGLLGFLLAAYSVVSLAGVRLSLGMHRESGFGVLIGTMNGIFTGMTGAFSFPGVIFLQALGLKKNELIQAMGMLFSASSLALGLALGMNGLVTVAQLGISAAAMIPVAIGLYAGKRLRDSLSETAFRRLFFWSLLLLGIYVIAKAWLQ